MRVRSRPDTVSVRVDVDIDDILDELSDDDLIDLLDERGLSGKRISARDDAETARECLLRGDAAEALIWLERALDERSGVRLQREYAAILKERDPVTGRPLMKW